MRNSFIETWLPGTACMLDQYTQCCYLSDVTLHINFRIDMNMVIKVADFGLAVNTEDKDYYRLSTNMGVKLPVKWMAPESLANRVFSETSDVVRLPLTSNHYTDHMCMDVFIHMHAVELWSDLLGDIYRRPSSLCRD